jgi:hypothetical protein
MTRRLRKNADEPVSRQGWVEAMTLPDASLPYRDGRYDPFGKSSAVFARSCPPARSFQISSVDVVVEGIPIGRLFTDRALT